MNTSEIQSDIGSVKVFFDDVEDDTRHPYSRLIIQSNHVADFTNTGMYLYPIVACDIRPSTLSNDAALLHSCLKIFDIFDTQRYSIGRDNERFYFIPSANFCIFFESVELIEQFAILRLNGFVCAIVAFGSNNV